MNSRFPLPFLLLALFSGEALAKNGFDLSDALVPIKEIRAGGPPRDGIPPIRRATCPAKIVLWALYSREQREPIP